MVLIRQAEQADIHQLVDLGKRTFYDAFAADNDPADMAEYLAHTFSYETLEEQLAEPDSTFLLADVAAPPGPQSVGYAHLIANSPPPHRKTGKSIQLSRLYVEQCETGKGYGAQLMKACLEYSANNGFDKLWLGVWEKNFRALKFYQRWGFQTIGTQAFILGKDVQTDYVLIRSVTPV